VKFPEKGLSTMAAMWPSTERVNMDFIPISMKFYLFQNNNRGGYNVGDATNKAAGGNKDNQYNMVSFITGIL
jgi:hypothetical protein